jgi:hypothetical protein
MTTLYSRREYVLNHRFPNIASALQDLPNETVIDGELVALGPDGRPDFHLLQRQKLLGELPVCHAFPCHVSLFPVTLFPDGKAVIARNRSAMIGSTSPTCRLDRLGGEMSVYSEPLEGQNGNSSMFF